MTNVSQSELYLKYDQLGNAWKDAAKSLGHAPHDVYIEMWDEVAKTADGEVCVVHHLGFVKLHGEWIIAHDKADTPESWNTLDWRPIVDCSLTIRVESAKYLGKLREAIQKARNDFAPRVDEAIQILAVECF